MTTEPRWTVPAVGKRATHRKHWPAVEARYRELRDAAWAAVQSVPYRVTLRWVFYRLLQDGLFTGKEGYKELERVLSEARHQSIDSWGPGTLADEGRELTLLGRGLLTDEEWLNGVTRIHLDGRPDYWKHQPCYLIVAFEAAAMRGQFDYHLPSFVSRCAFKGDDSIDHKYRLGRAIDGAFWLYEEEGEPVKKPIVVLYFGDDDRKGWEIPQIVERDIRSWTSTPFEWVRAGLNEGQGAALGIPENPDLPGTYQWEAVDDDVAGTLITEGVDEYLDPEGEDKAKAEGQRREMAWERWWDENRPKPEDLGLGTDDDDGDDDDDL